MYSVSQVIEQLLVTNPQQLENEAETICECSLGCLKFNSVTTQQYETIDQCSKKAICYFVATEKHKARINTKDFLRHKEFNEKREKAKRLSQAQKSDKAVSTSPQKTLLDFLK